MHTAGRWWLLMGAAVLVGCDAGPMDPSEPTIPSTSSEPSDPTPPDTDTGRPGSLGMWEGLDSGSSHEEDEATPPEDPLAEGLEACAHGELEPEAFDEALQARLCEEWEACDGTECVPGEGSEAAREEERAFDAEAACDCLTSTWSCETSYGASAELWVVVPDASCFAVYEEGSQ